MTADRFRGEASRLEVLEVGRRRRWSAADKVRIVEESLAGPRRVSAPARRHGISRSRLMEWRRAYREGRLAGAAEPAFVPVRVRDEVPATSEAAVSPPPPAASAGDAVAGRTEIELAGGSRVVVGAAAISAMRTADVVAGSRTTTMLQKSGLYRTNEGLAGDRPGRCAVNCQATPSLTSFCNGPAGVNPCCT